jgi:Ca-activated chloride channel family protein
MRRIGLILVVLLIGAAIPFLLRSSPGPEFTIRSGSENRSLQPIVEAFCASRNATCRMEYEGSLEIGLSLRPGQTPPVDAVWPASSLWIELFDTGRRVKHAQSIYRTPVVLGIRRSEAARLGFVDRDVPMADILKAVADKKLRFMMTSATQSNSGASAYLAMLSTALGDGDVIERQDLDDAGAISKLRTLLSGVERSAGSSGWLGELFVEEARKGNRPTAMWNYETVIAETNQALRAINQEVLHVVYPADGVGMADSPLGFLDRGRGADVEAFFRDLQAHLLSAAVQRDLGQRGHRVSEQSALPQRDPITNLDPRRLLTVVRPPERDVLNRALAMYQTALRRPSLTAFCLDYSGSMRGDGETALEKAVDLLFTPALSSEFLLQWTEQDRIFAIPFDQRTRQVYEISGTSEEQEGLRDKLRTNEASGGTDIYSCASRALTVMRNWLDRELHLPAIVIMTDGRSQGDARGFLEAWRRSPHKVPVFGVTFGEADKAQLDILAKETGGRVFDGARDLSAAFRAVRAYN